MCSERSKYRKLCRVKKRDYNRGEAQRLAEISDKDPKTFWKEIKGGKGDVLKVN